MTTFEELRGKVGETLGTSAWVEVGQQRIDQFAEATDDHQFIHVDPERAKDTPFGQTIAHGFLSLSMLAPFANELALPAHKVKENYGFEKVRFLSPVKSGRRVRGRFVLKDLTEKRPGQWQLVTEATVEIEGEDKPALLAEWIVMMMV